MKKSTLHPQIHFYLTLLVAFFLPLARLVPILIILLVLNWLIERDFKQKFRRILTAKFGVLFCLLFITHVIGLSYTENMNSGLFDIQVKLSLLVFPLLYASNPIGADRLKYVFLSFLSGCLLCSLILLTRSTALYLATCDSSYFFYEPFSAYLIHPSYLAMYVNLTICWILLQLKEKSLIFGRYTKSLSALLIVFFSGIIILLSSKLGMITLALIYFISFIYYSRKKYIVGLAGILLTILTGVAVFKFVPAVTERIQNSINSLTAPTVNNADAESTTVRMLVWKAANQVIAEHPFLGVGTGDSKDALMQEYQKQGMTGAYEHKLNAHNEFYQTFVSLGVIGFTILCLQLFLPLTVSIKQKKSIYTVFLIIVILNFLPESMLESEGGVIFYAFFNSLLCFSFFSQQPNTIET